MVWYHLGFIYQRQAKYDVAEYCLRHALTLLPPLRRDVEIHWRVALCCKEQGKHPEAIEAWKASVAVPARAGENKPWLEEKFLWFEMAIQYGATHEDKLAARCYSKSTMNPVRAATACSCNSLWGVPTAAVR